METTQSGSDPFEPNDESEASRGRLVAFDAAAVAFRDLANQGEHQSPSARSLARTGGLVKGLEEDVLDHADTGALGVAPRGIPPAEARLTALAMKPP